MKKAILLIVIPLLLFASEETKAETECECCSIETCVDPFYVEVAAGGNFLQVQRSHGLKVISQPGYIIAGSLGYRWNYGLRLEFEYAFRRNPTKKIHVFGRSNEINGHFQSSSYMANLLWDLPISSWGCDFWQIRPFVGGGIGCDHQQITKQDTTLTFSQNNKGFSWQLIAGLGYPIFCHSDISLEYKFHKGGFSIYNHSILLGLTYNFGL